MIWLLVLALLLLFSFVILFGAPYLPTQKQQIRVALDLLDLKKGQTLLELGCGDGRVLKAAAKRGVRAVGFELNPVLVIAAKLYTRPYRELVEVRWGNYWRADWPEADGVYVFLLDRYMDKLDQRIKHHKKLWNKKHLKLASYTFKIPNKQPAKKSAGVFLYEYK